MTHERFRELLPLYVLGALDGRELTDFENYLAANRMLCATEIAEYQAIADRLAYSAPAVAPPAQVWERIEAAIKPVRTQPAVGRPLSPAMWLPWALAAAACVVLALTLSSRRALERDYNTRLAAANERINDLSGQIAERDRTLNEVRNAADRLRADVQELKARNETLGVEKAALIKTMEDLRQRLERQDLRVVSLQKLVDDQSARLDVLMDPGVRVAQMSDPAGKTKASAKVFWHEQKQSGLIVVSNATPTPRGEAKALELWMICEGQPPVPAGVFYTDNAGHGIGEIQLAKQVTCAAKFAVSVEPAGGVSAPTGPIILLGQ